MQPEITIKILLGLLFSVVVFHLAIISKLIPYEIAWGGRLENDSDMYVFESISILVNLFLAWILLMKGGFAKRMISIKTINIFLWCFLVLFLLNTIGNTFAKTNFEKSFAVLTLALSAMLYMVLRSGPLGRNR